MATPTSTPEPEPVIRRSDDIEYETVSAADGLEKGVLISDDHGAPNFAIRRFVLEAGASVPAHTNEVEHEQYVLEGEYTVGIGNMQAADSATGDAVDSGEEYMVEAGDSLLIPAGTVHWYRNESDEPGAFLCAVPNGDDEIDLLE
ncbi:cupin domain-containing protein [Natronorubrum sulfidifaciens]|nr:cupin domain-containing protein [Natronorubrum sulfidifaciens]